MRLASAVRIAPQHRELAGSRREDAGQHLDRGALPGAVRADERHELARGDRQVESFDRDALFRLEREQILQGAEDAGSPIERPERPPETARDDDRIGGQAYAWCSDAGASL